MLKEMLTLFAACTFVCASCVYADELATNEQEQIVENENTDADSVDLDEASDDLASLDFDDFDDFLEDDDELDAFTSSDLCDPEDLIGEEHQNIT